MLTAYRIAYGLVLVVFLGNVLKTIDFKTAPAHVSVLLVAAVVSLSGLFVLLLGFSRIRQTAFWVLVVIWEAFFVWYAWFVPAAPFTLREAHSFDAAAVAHETTVHYLWAGALFAALFAWFLSLPIVRRRRREGVDL
jgi:glucan phosphoethanolaminetransferase (alkaline phosphatase superfamily)